MKNLLLLLSILTLVMLSNTYAQTGWFDQTNPLGIGEQAMIGKIQFVSQTEGWISCGSGGMLHTTNSGDNWTYVNPYPNDTIGAFSDPGINMSWAGVNNGWILFTLGGIDNPTGTILYKTTNGGVSWDRKIISSNVGDIGVEIQFTDANNGSLLYFNFNNGVASFLRTTDGGNTWNNKPAAGIFFFVNNNIGWAYAGSGQMGSDPPYIIYNSTDGGESWNEQFRDYTLGQFSAMRFTDVNNGWIVGKNGKVLKTNNGGSNWTLITNSGVNTNSECKTLFFLDANAGWISSKSDAGYPFIVHTTNGGNTWTTQSPYLGGSTENNAIFSIFFWDINNGWLTADFGRISRYINVSDVSDDEENLSEFNLKQNYPNPFNPATTIEYVLNENSWVRLTLLNSLGEEIAILADKEMEKGVHKIEFSSKNIPSGIYYYQLSAHNSSSGENRPFVQTRKMVILK
uniref:Photosynthesis system II assembly factor Ycf48/Hcf136-like domain-containing protein n=1 Tax=Ignavibacterium album TaxID=591197 RepID=A0A7V3E6M3_9BACT